MVFYHGTMHGGTHMESMARTGCSPKPLCQYDRPYAAVHGIPPNSRRQYHYWYVLVNHQDDKPHAPAPTAPEPGQQPVSASGHNVPEALVDWPFRCGRRCHRLPPLWSFPTSPISLFPLKPLRPVAIRDAVESFQVGGENEYLVKICMSRPVSHWQVLDFKRRQLIDAKSSYAPSKLADDIG